MTLNALNKKEVYYVKFVFKLIFFVNSIVKYGPLVQAPMKIQGPETMLRFLYLRTNKKNRHDAGSCAGAFL